LLLELFFIIIVKYLLTFWITDIFKKFDLVTCDPFLFSHFPFVFLHLNLHNIIKFSLENFTFIYIYNLN